MLMSKKVLGILIAAAVLIIGYFLPEPTGLTAPGKMGLVLLLSGIVLWLFESFPVAITGFLLLMLMPYLGVISINDTIAGFMSSVLLFIMGAFSMTIAMMKTKLGIRITGILLKWAGDSSEKLVLGFMFAGSVVSSIMQNTPTTLLFLGIAYTLINAMNVKPGESNLAKCLMLGIPIAVMTGGTATPIGTAINIIGIEMLAKVTGITISFAQWTIIAYPMALAMTFIAWLFIVKTLKPEKIDKSALAVLETEVANAGKMTAQEIKLITIVAFLLILWFASTWFPVINSTMVALLGLVLMFMPGINLLTWKDYSDGVPWNVVLVIGCIMSVAGGILKTGGAKWMAETVVASASGLPSLVILLIVTTFVVVLHAVFPMGPAIVGLLIPPLVTIAVSTGYFSPAVIAIIISMGVGVCYILPLNPVLMITYSAGHYKMIDVIKSGFIPTIAFILLLTFWTSLIAPLVGL